MVRKATKKRRKTRRRRHRGGSQNYLFLDMLNNIEGLGNQLNLYCAALIVKKKINLPLCLIRHEANAHSDIDYSKLFDGVLAKDVNISPERIKAAALTLPGLTGFGEEWSEDNIMFNPQDPPKDYMVHSGRVPIISYRPLYKVFPQVKEMLMKNEFGKDAYKKYRDTINNKCAYMHVRKGDFKERGWNLHEDYYGSALAKLESAGIDTIYIFSNDIPWCKSKDDKWKKSTTKKLVYDETPNELEVLYMMSLCTGGAILSASTFSSWGAYLGADMNPNSVIVYKHKIVQENNRPNPYQYPDKWIGL
jgi:hypothetical protein